MTSYMVTLFDKTVDLCEPSTYYYGKEYCVYRMLQWKCDIAWRCDVDDDIQQAIRHFEDLGYIGSLREYLVSEYGVEWVERIESDPLWYASSCNTAESEYAMGLI